MKLDYKPPLPINPKPIVIIGAGGIVSDAHLPAYNKARFEVIGIVDKVIQKAEALADKYYIPNVPESVSEAADTFANDVVYDIAILPDQLPEVLSLLPDNAVVLMQKPMGDYIEKSREILDICKKKKLTAGVNFQLQFAPFVLAAKRIIESGLIGELYDMEVRLTTYTPWKIFPTLMHHNRLEVMYHSIHYIDLIRSFLGVPKGILAKTLKYPGRDNPSSRSTIIFDYDDTVRGVINTNHDHLYGSHNQESFIKWEGTKGAIKAKMGLLLDYPKGVPDKFEYCILKNKSEPKWESIQLNGSWFPDAFIGSMSSIMRFSEGSDEECPINIDRAFETMIIAESVYTSNENGGVSLGYWLK